MAAAEWWFYHIERGSLDAAIAPLIEKCLERKWRVVVAGHEDTVERLDRALWTFRDDSFVPHGRARADAEKTSRAAVDRSGSNQRGKGRRAAGWIGCRRITVRARDGGVRRPGRNSPRQGASAVQGSDGCWRAGALLPAGQVRLGGKDTCGRRTPSPQ
jgi:hypothetical protein